MFSNDCKKKILELFASSSRIISDLKRALGIIVLIGFISILILFFIFLKILFLKLIQCNWLFENSNNGQSLVNSEDL